MDDEDFLNNFNQEIDEEKENLKNENIKLGVALSNASYQSPENANLIQYQLDTGEMLGKIEHFLRGEYMTTDLEGNEYWATQEDKTLVLFNDYGVNAVISIIGNYIDKNTMLSHYDEIRINEILADLGDELANFIYCNYEKMGMDTNFKKTRFQLTVLTILHSIESSYRRALRGRTMEDLNSSRIFTQTDSIGNKSFQQEKSFNLFDRKTW